MDLHLATSGITWELVVFCGLSLSVGWGIRGNFGHEYGAAIPGALAAIAAVLVSGRPDWLAHVHYFALFGRRHIPFAFRHIRFGPEATTREELTESGKPWKSQ